MVDRARLGNAVLTRVLETSFEPGVEMFGQTPEQAWSEHADLLVPTFLNPDTRRWRVAIQTWVIDVDGLRVLIDTGVGNGRDRPIPVLNNLDTGFLAALAAAGISPDSVDVVLNTHLHTDHVGWNTTASDGHWVPTFPNARYLLPEADFRYFGPGGAGCDAAARVVFDDSVAPVYEAATGRIVQRGVPIERVGVAAARGGTHPGVIGAVAGRRQAGGVRRGSDPLPHPDSAARGSVRVRSGRRRRRRDP